MTRKTKTSLSCEGILTLPDQNTPIQGVITIDIKYQQDQSFTKLFSGSLNIDGIEFDLIFESSYQATGDDSQTFVAAYHDDKGDAISIDNILKNISAEPPKTGLEITIKDALFAYQGAQTNPKSKYLFGLDIEGGLNLSDSKLPTLPLIGQPFPPGQTLKPALHIPYANHTFDAKEVSNLNKLSKLRLSLPEQEVTESQTGGIAANRGEETKPFEFAYRYK